MPNDIKPMMDFKFTVLFPSTEFMHVLLHVLSI